MEYFRNIGVDLAPQNITTTTEIDRFGSYVVQIEEFYSEKFDQKFNFKARVNVHKEVSEEVPKALEA